MIMSNSVAGYLKKAGLKVAGLLPSGLEPIDVGAGRVKPTVMGIQNLVLLFSIPMRLPMRGSWAKMKWYCGSPAAHPARLPLG